MKSSNYLCVVGYSFRDKHINTFITQWFAENPDGVMMIVGVNVQQISEATSNGNICPWKHLQKERNQRVFLVECKFKELTNSKAFQNGMSAELRIPSAILSVNDLENS